jgi:DNA-binding GntR family transcriptional regulator
MDAIHQAHHAFHLPLFAPAATAWDVRILMTLWRAAERYIRIGFGRLDPDPNEHQRREHAHVDLIAAFRRRDPDAAADAVNTHLTHNETIAHHALTPLHG